MTYVANYTMVNQGGSVYTYEETNYSEGAYGIYIRANDTSGNIKSYQFDKPKDLNEKFICGLEPVWYDLRKRVKNSKTVQFLNDSLLNISSYKNFGLLLMSLFSSDTRTNKIVQIIGTPNQLKFIGFILIKLLPYCMWSMFSQKGLRSLRVLLNIFGKFSSSLSSKLERT